MRNHAFIAAALFAALTFLPAVPALAQGEVQITQAKANAGNVTPGDAAGFPVTLSLPGSYIFASNLQPPADKAGIRIASNDVTIDLNGFRLRGAMGATTGIYGAAFESATIRNGTIAGFDAHGIYGTGDSWIVESMRVVENGAYGIYVSGSNSAVRNSTVVENGNTGVLCFSRCLVEDSTISGNGGVGILIGSGAVLNNSIVFNDGFEIQGTTLTGYGNNTLAANNGGGAQVNAGLIAMHPNACAPAACP